MGARLLLALKSGLFSLPRSHLSDKSRVLFRKTTVVFSAATVKKIQTYGLQLLTKPLKFAYTAVANVCLANTEVSSSVLSEKIEKLKRGKVEKVKS